LLGLWNDRPFNQSINLDSCIDASSQVHDGEIRIHTGSCLHSLSQKPQKVYWGHALSKVCKHEAELQDSELQSWEQYGFFS